MTPQNDRLPAAALIDSRTAQGRAVQRATPEWGYVAAAALALARTYGSLQSSSTSGRRTWLWHRQRLMNACRKSRGRAGRGETSPGADVAGVSLVPVQMWRGRAQSSCYCGRGEPSVGADMAAVSPIVVLLWQG